MTRPKNFIAFANIFLGLLCGLLIALPLATTMDSPYPGLGLIVFSCLFGALAGYKRGDNRAFMYMCIAFVCILSTLISFSMT